MSSSIFIGSYLLNVYIFEVKLLQKNGNSLILDSWLFDMDFSCAYNFPPIIEEKKVLLPHNDKNFTSRLAVDSSNI